MKRVSSGVLVLALAALMCGCSATHQNLQAKKPSNADQLFKSGRYEQKVRNFAVILDASWSMGQTVNGEVKYDVARNLINQMNYSLPQMPLNAEMITFGTGFLTPAEAIYGMTGFSRSSFEQALQGASTTGWTTSRLDKAIKIAGRDLSAASGKSAIIIFADGICVERTAIQEVEKIKNQLGDNVCVYTVGIGDDAAGLALLQKLVETAGCGTAFAAADLRDEKAMAGLVEQVFMRKVGAPADSDSDGDGVADSLDKCPGTPKGVKVNPSGCPLDSDGDGVPDYRDVCPNTAANTIVDDNGCPLTKPKGAQTTERGSWIFKDILFDTNKWDVKPALKPILDDVAKIMKDNPEMKMEIQGHTDDRGSDDYNMMLSAKRAESVKNYLVASGIEPFRLHSVGYGETKPIASNDAPSGRYMNRRVEFFPLH